MPTTLVIQQVPGAFQVTRPQPFKQSKPVKLPSPYSWPVEGRPNSNLMSELQWYLEKFLDYPFPPETEHADRILDSLKLWGEQAFESLFGNLSGGSLFQAATTDDYRALTLQIASDDPGVLSWPWEALRDPQLGTPMAHACQIERRLSEIRDAPPQSVILPQERVNILLVVARPYGANDVRYRSIARSLVELIAKHNLPAHVDLLRPPTFARLREHLKQNPGYYHILHFDGHGAYSPSTAAPSQHSYRSAEGKLVFETPEGTDDPITASQLNDLLRDYAVPGIVLNACQSAMVAQESQDAFSSVAAALLRSGARGVVAMAYSLYVAGAQEFLPAFYRSLFETGSMAEAARAGRQQMRAHPKRVCARGRFDLDDWLLPVLYQQAPLDLSFAAKAAVVKAESRLPDEFRREKNPYGFVGRDSALLALERAMLRPPAGILIQGLGGIGKTTLARSFVRWLEDTNGLGEGAFWLDFREIRSAEYVLNQIGEPFFGPNFGSAPPEAKLEALVNALREHRFVIVWDNFESASGIPGTSVTANLLDEDRTLLARFLEDLRGGATKVLITSRSEETWLGPQCRWKLPLTGFDGEERWEYCETIVGDLGLTVDRKNKDYAELMKQLGGHPLAMRVILPQLEKHSAAEISEALRGNLQKLDLAADDEASEQLFAALRFIEHALPESLRPLLVPLSLHGGWVDLGYLEDMAKLVPGDWSRSQIDQLAAAVVNAGLFRDRGQAAYELHPALTVYLRLQLKGSDEWSRAFVEVMADISDAFARRPLIEQRVPLRRHSANFYTALVEAGPLGMHADEAALTQGLAMWALDNRDFVEAERLFLHLAQHGDAAVASYHQLGMVAHMRRDLAAAESWYRKSAAISEEQRYEGGASRAYHQLGIVAQEQRDLVAAERWYLQALVIQDKQGNEHDAATTCHQLGRVAEERRDFTAAEQWYLKSLAIKEKQPLEYDAAITYHRLAVLAHKQGNLAVADQWYLKSLAIDKMQGNQHGVARTYHQMGMVAQERGNFTAAEQWYRKSLAIKDEQDNEHGAASTYHQMGRVAHEQRDLAAAEQWYLKSLATKEKLGNQYGAAITYHWLGSLAAEQHRLLEAGEYCMSALTIFRRSDAQAAQQALDQFVAIHGGASADVKRELEAQWAQAGLGPLPPQENS